ncbi:YceD family protein [Paenibacillus cellulositrophicus]|uniref:YceD family protein n=1 Tax=Paenibacillus cellulositrophicus TaxID=562959 RepID=UPI00203DB62F|nr:YceD family protein [Paenibacillus cellulositrophicus]MCM2997319.1 YceD family protein [Paenibacillus cellulositrophicus]
MHFQFRKMAASSEPLQLRQQVDVSPLLKGLDDIKADGPLTAELTASYVGPDTVVVQGELSVQLDMSCSRCLTPVHEHLDIPFHEQFKLKKQPEEAEDEEDETIYVDNETVELVPYVEESFILNLPMTVVCKESCKGLCPTCGRDLNEGACGCNNEVVDPRLAALKDFFK